MGYKIAMGALTGGRIGIGAQSVGIAQGALNEAIKYVKRKKTVWKTNSKIPEYTVLDRSITDKD